MAGINSIGETFDTVPQAAYSTDCVGLPSTRFHEELCRPGADLHRNWMGALKNWSKSTAFICPRKSNRSRRNTEASSSFSLPVLWSVVRRMLMNTIGHMLSFGDLSYCPRKRIQSQNNGHFLERRSPRIIYCMRAWRFLKENVRQR